MVVLTRHSLVWLHAAGWRAVLEQTPDPYREEIMRWRDADWPLTVRRQDAKQIDDKLYLGIALPPRDDEKIRLPFRVAINTIARSDTALPLMKVVPSLPLDWQDAVSRLNRAADEMGVSVGVYGSAALQSITGLTYLHAASDIDVLLQPSTTQQLDECVRLFREFELQLPLDGEIVFDTNTAVAAREWCGAARHDGGFRVLIKRPDGVALMRKDALISLLDCQPCMPM